MQAYVHALREGEEGPRLAALFGTVLAHPALHARMLNTLARLEYVGVRKILKSRRAECLDLDGLQHIVDEAIHALRLKRAAVAAAAGLTEVDTFAPAHTLAGEAAEGYLQGVDAAAEAALEDLPEAERLEANYLLTSAAVEIRAQSFYPAYEAALRATGSTVSVAAILRDEDRHLAEAAAGLAEKVPGWRRRLEEVLTRERALFSELLTALIAAAGDLPAVPRRVAGEARS